MELGSVPGTTRTGDQAGLVGTTVGSYRIVARIGSGGMGAVYLAEHPRLGKRAAIKVMLPSLSQSPDATARFHGEARAAAQLRHPAFVPVFDFGHLPDGSAFIAMDLLEGRSLRAVKRDQQRLPLAVALKIGRQLAAGMAVAHEAGIVHRDLKPDNVFLEINPADPRNALVKILDFGVAKLVQGDGTAPITQSGAVLGTPLYMSPEQCRGEGGIDGRSDIYAWGCLLYSLLTGEAPFEKVDGYAGVITAHLFTPPTPPREHLPTLPADVDRLIMRCLAKDRQWRPSSMRELVSDLDQIAEALELGSLAVGPHLDEVGIVPTSERSPAPPTAPSDEQPAAQSAESTAAAAATRRLPQAHLPTASRAGEVMEEPHRPAWKRRGIWLGASLLALVVTVVVVRSLRPGGRPSDQAPAATTTAAALDPTALVARGNQLRRAGNDHAALALMQKAYELARTPKHAIQVGLAEAALDRWADAERHLREGLKAKDDPWITRHRTTLEETLEHVNGKLGRSK
jgi:serine/threonine-protein kinase